MSKEDLVQAHLSENPQFGTHAEWHAAFLQNTSQKRVQEIEALFRLQLEFPHMRERILNPNNEFELLFIGGGTGKAEIALAVDIATGGSRRIEKLLQEGGEPFDKIGIFYNDPSPNMHKQFKDAIEKIGIEKAVKAYTLRKFEDPTYIPPDVDLALAFQMWYYVGGWQGVPFEQNSLVRLARTVQEKEGVAVVSVQSEDGDLFKIRGKQFPKIHGYDDLTAERVTEELDRLGLTFKTSTAKAPTNVSSCFQGEEFSPTDEGKNILSFMLRTPWDTISKLLQQEIGADIKRLVVENQKDPIIAALYSNTKTLFLADTYIFILGKQPRLAVV